jgi:lipopolysaccharide export system protein LptA
METVSGKITRISNKTKITDDITAQKGQYNRANKTITLIGDVHIDSSNGDKVRTKELVIKL